MARSLRSGAPAEQGAIPGTRAVIPDYEILGVLGQGGVDVVLKAR